VGIITNDDEFKIVESMKVNEPSPQNIDKEIIHDEDNKPFHAMTPNISTNMVSQIPKERILNSGGSHNLISKRNNTGSSSRMIINRYPGYLFIQIDQVERFMAARNGVEAISIKIESEIFSYETKEYRPWTNININEMIRIPIDRMENSGFHIKFILILHHKSSNGIFSSKEITKTCEIILPINISKIHSIHNNLLENTSRWNHYTSKNFFKNLKGFFINGTTDAWSLKSYLSFISNDELQLIPAPLPYDLRSLSKWLIVKKYSYNMWFKGFINVRGDINNVCTNLWKRRYVKCYGYIIFIFNEHSRSLIGTINLVDSNFDPEIQSKIYLENFLNISIGSNNVEFHFDTKDKYDICKNALISMLPQTLFHKKK